MLANSGRIRSGMRPPREVTDPAGVTLIEPGARFAISIVEVVETSELSDPLLSATWDDALTESPVPPVIAQRCTATPGDDDTDTAVWAPSHPIVSASRTTAPAH